MKQLSIPFYQSCLRCILVSIGRICTRAVLSNGLVHLLDSCFGFSEAALKIGSLFRGFQPREEQASKLPSNASQPGVVGQVSNSGKTGLCSDLLPSSLTVITVGHSLENRYHV